MNSESQLRERQRGRPVDTGQQDLRVQILDCAEGLFSAHGYAATPVRRIAEQAGVNPALVHYYFGDKKSLLQQVMERALKPMIHAIAAMKDDPETTPDSIARLLVSMASERPSLPRLMTREVLLPGGEMQQYFAENMAPHLGGALPPLLSQAQSAGRMRTDSDPGIAAVLILGVCFFPFIARDLAGPALGIRYDAEGTALLTRQVTQLLRHGMAL